MLGVPCSGLEVSLVIEMGYRDKTLGVYSPVILNLPRVKV